jgi:hypothetical protein
LETAKCFCHGNGTVYVTTVRREDVYARVHESGRNEDEMLVVLDDPAQLQIVTEIKS